MHRMWLKTKEKRILPKKKSARQFPLKDKNKIKFIDSGEDLFALSIIQCNIKARV